MTPAIHFEALKQGARQLANGDWQVSFKIQGHDMNRDFLACNPGQRFMLALSAIADDETALPVEEAARQSKQANKQSLRWDDMKLTQQAGIRCSDPDFIEWFGGDNPEHAAELVRLQCGVESRSRLDEDREAGNRWRQIDSDFQEHKAQERAEAMYGGEV